MKEGLLILFSKSPHSGQSKTRIIKEIGSEMTKKFCFACLDDTALKMKKLKEFDTIIVSDKIEDSVYFSERYCMQALSLEEMDIDPGANKSQKFHKIFEYFLKSYSKVILMPMDVPHVSISAIKTAFSKLDYFDNVYGPESNGGVYLMGVRNLLPTTFTNVRWSTENSFRDLTGNSHSYFLLETSFDLNTFEDLNLLKEEDLQSCPNLTRFIKSLFLQRILMEREVTKI